MWKVIIIDNFGRDNYPEYLYKGDLTEQGAKKLANKMNTIEKGQYPPDFYKAVPDSYELSDGTESY